MSRYMVLSGSLLRCRDCNRFFDAVKDFFLGSFPSVDHVWTMCGPAGGPRRRQYWRGFAGMWTMWTINLYIYK